MNKYIFEKDNQLTKHFKTSEVYQEDFHFILSNASAIKENALNQLYLLEKIRYKVGRIVVTSFFRPPVYNKSVFGDKTSNHIYGKATDFRTPDTPIDDSFKIIKDNFIHSLEELFLYKKKGFIHIAYGDNCRVRVFD